MAGRALSRRKLGNSDNAKGLLAYAVFAAVTIAAFAVIQLEVPAPYMVRPATRRAPSEKLSDLFVLASPFRMSPSTFLKLSSTAGATSGLGTQS